MYTFLCSIEFDEQVSCGINTDIYKGDPRPGIPPHVMASLAMGLKVGVFRFYTQKQTRPRSSRAVRHFMHVYLHAQIAVDAGDIHTWRTTVILIQEKPKDPQFEHHAGIKMAQVLGSPLYICGYQPK